jgi:hypothetical protein
LLKQPLSIKKSYAGAIQSMQTLLAILDFVKIAQGSNESQQSMKSTIV